MDLTTVARVKTLAKIDVASFDTVLGQLVTDWSAAAEKYLNRKTETAAYTKQFDVECGQRVFALDAYGDPATALTEIKIATDRDFAGTSAEDLDDFYLEQDTGLVASDVNLSTGWGVLQIQWTGGMAADTSSFITAFPDVSEAVEAQVIHN